MGIFGKEVNKVKEQLIWEVLTILHKLYLRAEKNANYDRAGAFSLAADLVSAALREEEDFIKSIKTD